MANFACYVLVFQMLLLQKLSELCIFKEKNIYNSSHQQNFRGAGSFGK